MRPRVSQRAGERLIREYARRMYRRHDMPARTPLPDALKVALDRGDHVANVLADDEELRMIAAGMVGWHARSIADPSTQQAIELLALADTLADAKFPLSPAKSETVLTSADMVVPKERPRRREGLLKEAEKQAEMRGVFAFRAVFLIGPEKGPVRVGVSKQPLEQLRLMNRHCLLTSHIGLEGYAISDVEALRVVRAVIEYAKTRGLRQPRKDDVLMMPMATAVEVVRRISAQLGVTLLTNEQKKQAIAEFKNSEFERAGRSFDVRE